MKKQMKKIKELIKAGEINLAIQLSKFIEGGEALAREWAQLKIEVEEAFEMTIDEFENSVNLEFLGNYKLPEKMSYAVNAEFLDVTDGLIDQLPESVGDMSNLDTLKLKGNYIKQLPSSLKRLKKLDYLDLENNPISDFPDSIPESVTFLKIRYTDIRKISIESIAKLSNLTHLVIDSRVKNIDDLHRHFPHIYIS